MALPHSFVSPSSHLVQTMVPVRVTVFLSSFFSSALAVTLTTKAIATPSSIDSAVRITDLLVNGQKDQPATPPAIFSYTDTTGTIPRHRDKSNGLCGIPGAARPICVALPID